MSAGLVALSGLGIGLLVLGVLRIRLSVQQRALRRSIVDELDSLRAARLPEEGR